MHLSGGSAKSSWTHFFLSQLQTASQSGINSSIQTVHRCTDPWRRCTCATNTFTRFRESHGRRLRLTDLFPFWPTNRRGWPLDTCSSDSVMNLQHFVCCGLVCFSTRTESEEWKPATVYLLLDFLMSLCWREHRDPSVEKQQSAADKTLGAAQPFERRARRHGGRRKEAQWKPLTLISNHHSLNWDSPEIYLQWTG